MHSQILERRDPDGALEPCSFFLQGPASPNVAVEGREIEDHSRENALMLRKNKEAEGQTTVSVAMAKKKNCGTPRFRKRILHPVIQSSNFFSPSGKVRSARLNDLF